MSLEYSPLDLARWVLTSASLHDVMAVPSERLIDCWLTLSRCSLTQLIPKGPSFPGGLLLPSCIWIIGPGKGSERTCQHTACRSLRSPLCVWNSLVFMFWVEEVQLDAAKTYHEAAVRERTCTIRESQALALLLKRKGNPKKMSWSLRVYKKCLCGSVGLPVNISVTDTFSTIIGCMCGQEVGSVWELGITC